MMADIEVKGPMVSIIVPVTQDSRFHHIGDLLESFYPQDGNIDFEFIVVDVPNERRARIYRERFPWITLIQPERMLPGSQLRNLAIPKARGKIIVFWEDHIVVHRKYLTHLTDAFSKGYDIVGGPVENGNKVKVAHWVQYFSEYNKWLPIRPEGEVMDLPGCNFAYSSRLLKKLGPFRKGCFKLDSLYHERAKNRGNRLYFSHGLKVEHFEARSIVDFWSYRFRYGRLFASGRKFPIWKRFLYGILSPLIALNEYIRIFTHVRYDRFYLKKFFQCTPLLLPTLLIWMAGEFVGYISDVRESQ